MSAKRRQETIAQFSVPLEDVEDSETSTTRASVGCDDDYTMDDSDDDFLDSEDDCTFTREKGKNKKAGPSKSKGKGKDKAGANRHAVDGSSFNGKNPKVMLLSLKAVCLLVKIYQAFPQLMRFSRELWG
jgi:SWI/SNF-related matrix-associated actin-dependent regulator of chromatin subfamily A3